MGIEEGEEVQVKRICNVFKKIIKFPKSQEHFAHSDTGSLQDTKQTLQKYILPIAHY
jgi:hypothetical protein